MQRVVILFVGILSVVWATPFDPDSVKKPTPFWYKVKFGNDALSEGSEHEDDYEIGIRLERSENYKFINESGEGQSMQGLVDLFRDVKFCNILDIQKPPQIGCTYIANGNVYFIHVLSAIGIGDVNKAFEGAGIKECDVGKDGLVEVPPVKWMFNGCFRIYEDIESVFWMGVYDEDAFYQADVTDDIKDAFDNIERCDLTVQKTPIEGCALFDENGIHLINVLNELSIDDFEIIVSNLDIPECIFDKERGLINRDPCYWVNLNLNSIHFLNLHRRPKGGQDNDADDDSRGTYGTPDAEVSPLSVVESATGNGNLQQQLKLKGIFNQRSLVAKKANAVVPKKIQSRKQPQVVQ